MDANSLLVEAVERTRRIETRLTRYLTAIGHETGSRKPLWLGDGIVEAPSLGVSLLECVAAVPPEWDRDDEVTVMHKGQLLGCVLKP